MNLRFIGTDGSLGLRNGAMYKVKLITAGKYLIATINTEFCGKISCPYGSVQAFAKNWEL